MSRPRTLPALVAVLLLSITAVLFVTIIWIPLHEDASAQVEVEREDSSGVRSWSVRDREAFTALRDGARSAEPARDKPFRADRTFRLRVHGTEARIDEYEVRVDQSTSADDLLYVVERKGGGTFTGSARRNPELHAALRRLLAEPAPAR